MLTTINLCEVDQIFGGITANAVVGFIAPDEEVKERTEKEDKNKYFNKMIIVAISSLPFVALLGLLGLYR